MTILEVVVLILAVALAAGQLWLFLGSRRRSIAPPGTHVQEVHVRVSGGFDPDTIVVEAGKAVRLVFHRYERVTPRTDRIRFQRPVIDEPLSPSKATTVEFTPVSAGDYRFRCGRNFGVVIAVESGEGVRTNLGRGHKRHG